MYPWNNSCHRLHLFFLAKARIHWCSISKYLEMHFQRVRDSMSQQSQPTLSFSHYKEKFQLFRQAIKDQIRYYARSRSGQVDAIRDL